MAALPGAMIFIVSICFNLLSDGLRQAMEAGEIAEGDPEVLAWSLMGIGELVGMRWILWNGREELPPEVLDELGRIITRAIGSPDGSR